MASEGMVPQYMYWSDFVTRSSLFSNVLSLSVLGAEVGNSQRDFESKATKSTSTHASHLQKILTHRKFTQLWDLTRTPTAHTSSECVSFGQERAP